MRSSYALVAAVTVLLLQGIFPLPTGSAGGLEVFPREFASEIIHQSQTPLTGALLITDLNGDGRKELLFSDWNGNVFLKEEGKREARVVFREEPDEEGDNPIMGIEQPGGNFTGDNQVIIYGYSGVIRILTFDHSLNVERDEPLYHWRSEVFAMCSGNLLRNISGEELYFGDWKTPHILVLWKNGTLWEHYIMNSTAPVKSLLFTDLDPTVPGGELYATLDLPQNSTLAEIWINQSGGIQQKSLLSDRFLLTNVKEAHILGESVKRELVVTALSGKAYLLRYRGGEMVSEVIYDTEGGGGLEGLSTGEIIIDGLVNVTVMTGYSNILALSCLVGDVLKTEVVWSSPNIKEFELAGVLIGDYDSQIDGNEIYVTAYTGYIAEIYYARGKVKSEILDENGEAVERLEVYPGYTARYSLSLKSFTPGNLSWRLLINLENFTILPQDRGHVTVTEGASLVIPLFIMTPEGTPGGNYTLYLFVNHSGNSFSFTFPLTVKVVEIHSFQVEPLALDIDMFSEQKGEVGATFEWSTSPSYRFLLPRVRASAAPSALNYSVDVSPGILEITYTFNSSITSPPPGNYTYLFNISLGAQQRTVRVTVHLYNLKDILKVEIAGLKPGSPYIRIKVTSTSHLHSELEVFAGIKRGGSEVRPSTSLTLEGGEGELTLPFQKPLKEGESVEVFLYTPQGSIIYENNFVVKENGKGREYQFYLYLLPGVIALIVIILLIWAYRGRRAKESVEE